MRLSIILSLSVVGALAQPVHQIPGPTIDARTNPAISTATGDTLRCIGVDNTGTWTFNGTTKPGTHLCALNDGHFNDGTTNCSSFNLAIVRVDNVDFDTPANTHLTAVNCMTGYGSTANHETPVGWGNGSHGYCNSSMTTIKGGVGCDDGWKTSAPFPVNGKWYLFIFRQETGVYWSHDTYLLRSDDQGYHWCRRETIVANSGTCPVNATTAAGDPPVDPVTDPADFPDTYSDSGYPNSQKAGRMIPIAMCRDHTQSCPTVANGQLKHPDCDPTNYVCIVAEDGSFKRAYLSRFNVSDIEGMDVTLMEWLQNDGTWDAGFSAMPTAKVIYGGGDYRSGTTTLISMPEPQGGLSSIQYRDGVYLLLTHESSIVSWSPNPWGPYVRILNDSKSGSFPTPMLDTWSGTPANGSFVASVTVYDFPGGNKDAGHPGFQLYYTKEGTQYPPKGDAYRGFSHFRYSADNSPGTLPLRNLLFAYDAVPGWNLTSQPPFSQDWARDMFEGRPYGVGINITPNTYGVNASPNIQVQTYGASFNGGGIETGVASIGPPANTWAQDFPGPSEFNSNVPYTLIALAAENSTFTNRIFADFCGRKVTFGWRSGGAARQLCIGQNSICATTSVSQGSWHVFALTYDGSGSYTTSSIKIYYDGVLQPVAGSTVTPTFAAASCKLPMRDGNNNFIGSFSAGWGYLGAMNVDQLVRFSNAVKANTLQFPRGITLP